MTSHRVIGPRLSGTESGRWVVRTLGRLWWVVTAGLLAVGAAVNFDLMIGDRLGPLAGPSEVAAGDAASFAIPSTDFESLPRVRYAGTDLALIDARVIPENRSGSPIVVAELAVRNTTAVQTRLSLKMLNLLGSDGQITELDRFEYTEHRSRLVVDPGRSKRALVVFKVGAASSLDLGDYQLQVGEYGRWPASLPLDGSAVPVAELQPLEVIRADEQARYRGVTVELADAVTALEYGLYRAPVGQHLAVVTVTVTGSPSSPLAAIDRELWTLVDGNGEQRAIRVVPRPPNADDDRMTVELVFAYRTETSELTLMVGHSGERRRVAGFRIQSFE